MNSFLRNYATPLSLVTFAVAAATGVMMFFGIHGGLLGTVHEWVGLIFVAALILHLARNWRGVLTMVSKPRCKAVLGGLGAVAAVLIVLAVPFGSGGGRGHGLHGPHQVVHRLAAAPIAKLAPALGLTSDQAMVRLRKGGITVEGPQQSLAEIAEKQRAELPRLMDLMMTETDA